VEHASNPRRASTPDSRLAAATIVRRQDATDDLFVIWLEPDIRFEFAAGQYVTIGAGGIERPYSIASAPYEPHLELFIEFVLPEHGGHLTPLLYARQVGDVLTMRPKPKGQFTLRAGVRNHVMVATVTGIAPYRSMIRQFIHERETGTRGSEDDCRFFIMQGASHHDEFVYDRELLDLKGRYPDLIEVVCSVSRPLAERNSAWAGPVGRIHLLVEEYLDRWALPKDHTLVYLCGNPGMIKDATATLVPRGWAVLAEQYWPLKSQK
jgi:ferredoxin-NADP reductase